MREPHEDGEFRRAEAGGKIDEAAGKGGKRRPLFSMNPSVSQWPSAFSILL